MRRVSTSEGSGISSHPPPNPHHSGESSLKRSFQNKMSEKLDKKAEEEKRTRPSLIRPNSERAINRHLSSPTVSENKIESHDLSSALSFSSNLSLSSASANLDLPSIASLGTGKLEDMVLELKGLLAKERVRVRDAMEEAEKWKSIANSLQQELNSLKAG